LGKNIRGTIRKKFSFFGFQEGSSPPLLLQCTRCKKIRLPQLEYHPDQYRHSFPYPIANPKMPTVLAQLILLHEAGFSYP
jgi:hypothetical protein